MAISEQLGVERAAETSAGTIIYRESGEGSPIVFVHGVGVNGDLWRWVVPRLVDRYRCITPDLPWGSHTVALNPNADLSLPGMARIVAEFIDRLELDDVTIVGNDTGGAVCQALAAEHSDLIARLVLTPCDAFDKFPPTPQRYLEVVARSRALMWIVAYTARFKPIQRLPTAYGCVTRRPMPREIMRSFTAPIRQHADVRRDFRRMLRAVDTKYTFAAADGLRNFDKPALVLWAENDKIFPRDHGRRLAQLLPRGEFELIANSRTFIPEEQPERLADRLSAWLNQSSTDGV